MGDLFVPAASPREVGERVRNTGSPIKYGRSGNPTLNITVTNVLKLIEQK